jgi:hypothetical protein
MFSSTTLRDDMTQIIGAERQNGYGGDLHQQVSESR